VDIQLVKLCFSQRLRNHDNYVDSQHWYWRWFYTGKAIVCVLLNRMPPEEPWTWRDPNRHEHVDSVAYWDFGDWLSDYGTITDWSELIVGYGVRRNWHVHVIRNGNG
jgi:hypothetical protein